VPYSALFQAFARLPGHLFPLRNRLYKTTSAAFSRQPRNGSISGCSRVPGMRRRSWEKRYALTVPSPKRTSMHRVMAVCLGPTPTGYQIIAKNLTVGAASPAWTVTTGFLPSRDTCTSLYIVGEGREQDAEASRRDSCRGRRSCRSEQNLTSGAFRNQYEIFVSSGKTSSETPFQAGIYATAGFYSPCWNGTPTILAAFLNK
jgi:hypothetical protein